VFGSYTPLTYFFLALGLAAFVVEAWAFIDAITRPSQAFVAAGKLTKPAWLALTGASAFTGLLFPLISMFRLAGLVASIVYLIDVRPAIRESQGGTNRW